MKTSCRRSTRSDGIRCLASKVDVARPPTPAPTMSTGVRRTSVRLPLSIGSIWWNQLVPRGRLCAAKLERARALSVGRRGRQRQDQVLEDTPDEDPIDRPTRDRPKDVQPQSGVADQRKVVDCGDLTAGDR